MATPEGKGYAVKRKATRVSELMRAGDPLLISDDQIETITERNWTALSSGDCRTTDDGPMRPAIIADSVFVTTAPRGKGRLWLLSAACIAVLLALTGALVIVSSPNAQPPGKSRPPVSQVSGSLSPTGVAQSQAVAARQQQCSTALTSALNSMVIAYRWTEDHGGSLADRLKAAADALRRTGTSATERAELTQIWNREMVDIFRSGISFVADQIKSLCQ